MKYRYVWLPCASALFALALVQRIRNVPALCSMQAAPRGLSESFHTFQRGQDG